MRKISNIYWLGIKELRSFLHDFVLIGLVAYAFSFAVIMQARSFSQELHNASIAVVDEDRSELSRRIAHAFLPPLFQTPRPIAERDIVSLMNAGRYTFVIDIPPNFQRDVLAGREPALQIEVDATAMVQAGLGSGYAQQIVTTEISDFVSHAEGAPLSPVNLAVRFVRTSPPRGSPASWGSSTAYRCSPSSFPAPRSFASASTERWIIFSSCR